MFRPLKSMLSSFNTVGKNSNKFSKNPHMLFFELMRLWPEIVGDKLSTHSIPLKNTNKTLTILTDHPQWAQELSFIEQNIKRKIIRKIPNLSKEITHIKFQADNQFFRKRNTLKKVCQPITKEEVKEKPISLHPFSPEYKLYKDEADTIFNEIQDEETKDLLTSIFIHHKHQNK